MNNASGARRVAPLILLFSVACAAAPRPRPALPEPAPPPPAGPTRVPSAGGPVRPEPPREPPVSTSARVTIAAVGDVLMHDAVKRAATVHGGGGEDGFGWLFAPIADLLAATDLTFANLETPVAPQASKGSRPFVFDAPPALLGALRRAGVDLVSVANNHAFDQGREGFEETLRHVEASGLVALGAGPAPRAAGPVLVERNGLALALLGYTYGVNQPGNRCPPATPACLVAAELTDRDQVVEEVRAAAATADAVVVSVHWGTEYQQQPSVAEVELARRLADAGALVVIGHHPHVLQPVELYRRADGRTAVIAYSLGNFVSNQSRNYVAGVTPDAVAATRDGALLRVALARRDYGRGVTRVEVTGADFLPLWTENDTVEIDRRKEPSRVPAIRVVAVDRALAAVRAELAAFPDPVPDAARDRWIALRRREALYVARRSTVAALLGEDLLRTLAPAELEAAPPAVAAPAPAVTPPAAP